MRFDKVELTFDMYIAKPHAKTPLWLFDVLLLRRETILRFFQVLVVVPVILYELSPQDSETELFKMM